MVARRENSRFQRKKLLILAGFRMETQILYYLSYLADERQASQVVLVVKNPPANSGDVRDTGLIPGLGRFPGGGNGNLLSSILAWKNSWTEELGGLQSVRPWEVRHD